MSLRKLTFVALLWAFALNAPLPTANAAERREPFELRDGDRVVLLGGTFFERAQRYGYLETALQLRFPDRKFSVRNLGWSADTVFAESRGIFDAPEKGYARMIEQVKGLKPTVIFLHYGGNEAFNGEAYLDTFVKQYEKLLDDLAPTSAEMVLVSPLPLWQQYSPLPDVSQTNRYRNRFRGAIKEIVAKRSLHELDLFDELGTDKLPAYEWAMLRPLTHDGVTLTSDGYLIASGTFCHQAFGTASDYARDAVRLSESSDGITLVATDDNWPSIRVETLPKSGGVRARLQVDLKRMQADGINVEFARQIPRGRYQVVVDGSQKTEFDYAPKGTFVTIPPVYIANDLRRAVIDKNQMYFHRWRPQNVTYLFLFRKHEQGNNAKEVEEFEQIVAKLDDRIFELKQKTTEVTVEIVRVGDVEAGQ